MTSSVSHELMTPIRCVINFAGELIDNSGKTKKSLKRKATMIFNTSKLLEAQIKMLLDRSLLENG
jgi:K+-sensing histidine kinase KdpD